MSVLMVGWLILSSFAISDSVLDLASIEATCLLRSSIANLELLTVTLELLDICTLVAITLSHPDEHLPARTRTNLSRSGGLALFCDKTERSRALDNTVCTRYRLAHTDKNNSFVRIFTW